MPQPKVHVLYEDNHLLALAKPAGIATVNVAFDEQSLAKWAKAFLKRKYQKPGDAYVGVVSRLDAVVSGVALLAKTSKAAARLTEQFRNRTVKKTYMAAIEGMLRPSEGVLEDWLAKNEARQRMEVVSPQKRGAQFARLRYKQVKALGDTSIVEIELETGRKHQIRVQLASRRHPILGDQKYGSRRPFVAGIALHAARLVVKHPTSGELVDVRCPLPESWHKFGLADPTGKNA